MRIITALITPFLEGKVNLHQFEKNIEFQLEAGIEGLLVLGTTGEAATLSEHERGELIKTAVTVVNGRVPVLVGTGTNSTATTIAYTKEAERLGADSALIVTPYYNLPMEEGIYEHYASVCQHTHIPICLYNIPKRTGRNLSLELIKKLTKFDQIMGIKESSPDFYQLGFFIKEFGTRLKIWSGDDGAALSAMALGCDGLMSVASNLIPYQIKEIIDLTFQSNFKEAREKFFSLIHLFDALFTESNPIGIKAAMELCGYSVGSPRLPLSPMSKSHRERLQTILQELKCNAIPALSSIPMTTSL
ncbi:MAG: 4-hydroxy-tetrahydrodipicolinate synthase [Chlamydiia bacterium]|nr:4-hydroxy-tetrahydrodipicolinate synthase [Chlamydiia bacterium]